MKMKEEKQGYLLKIREAIERKEGLSFKYLRPDSRVIRHNAVYPREIYSDEKQTYFRAYCYFTRDVRSFRLDRVQSLRLIPKRGPLTLRDYIVVVIFIIMIPASYVIWTLTGGDPRGDWVLVTAVTDGDTVHVGRGWRRTTVRLIGVDAPETVHPEMPVEFYGPEASEFTEKSLTRQWVRLEFEPGNQIDVYGRLLAYIFLEDGTLFNRDIVRHGYARAYTRFPFRYQEEFRIAEIEARNVGRGLWVQQKREATSAHPLKGKIIGNRRSKVFHVPGQANYSRVSEENRVYFDTEEEAARAGYRRAKR